VGTAASEIKSDELRESNRQVAKEGQADGVSLGGSLPDRVDVVAKD
jgi:hypothetical protein